RADRKAAPALQAAAQGSLATGPDRAAGGRRGDRRRLHRLRVVRRGGGSARSSAGRRRDAGGHPDGERLRCGHAARPAQHHRPPVPQQRVGRAQHGVPTRRRYDRLGRTTKLTARRAALPSSLTRVHDGPAGGAMTNLTEILSSEAIDADLAAANKKSLFQQLAAAAAKLTGLAPKAIVAALNAREKLGSTGFGNGAAIPHGKLAGIDRVFGYFVRLDSPIDFQAVDGLPVDLVFLLLSPPDAGADHLKALASVSRTFR